MVEGRPEASSKVDGQVDGANAGPDPHLRAPIKPNGGGETADTGTLTGAGTVADAGNSDAGNSEVTAALLSGESLTLMAAESAGKKPNQKFPAPMPADKGDMTVPMPRSRPDLTSSASLLTPRVPFDNTKHTVIVMDDYRYADQWKLGEKTFSHGELIARINEENGFNAVRIQAGTLKTGMIELPKSLKFLNDSIDNGQISVKPGDVVNLSLSHSVTYDRLNNITGLNLTPENIASKREEVLAAFQAKVDDPRLSPVDRQLITGVLDITKQIRQLQARGLEVVAAAGNDGPKFFNIGLIAADKMFAAVGPDGKPTDYSQTSSMTIDGNGQVDFYSMPVRVLDPTPLAEQQGGFRLDGSKVFLPGSEFGGVLSTAPVTPELVRMMLSKTTIGSGNPDLSINLDALTKGNLALSVPGTSFVNIFELPKQKKPR